MEAPSGVLCAGVEVLESSISRVEAEASSDELFVVVLLLPSFRGELETSTKRRNVKATNKTGQAKETTVLESTRW